MCSVIQKKACLEVVRAVADAVNILGELLDVGVIDVGYMSFNFDERVDTFQFPLGCNCFGKFSGNVVFVVQNLPVKIRNL